MSDDVTDALAKLIRQLTDLQRRMVLRFIQTIRNAPVAIANPDSEFLSDPNFAREFSTGLAFHHALQEVPLSKKAFEYTFRDACRSAGWQAELGASATYPGADILVNGVGISLKTEAAANINPDRIHISKFRESAATKSMTTPEEFHKFVQTVLLPHLEEYDRIVMLRAFSLRRLAKWQTTTTADQGIELLNKAAASGDRVVYFLVEIPTSLLERMGQLAPSDITLIGNVGSAKADVMEGGQVLFNLFFDGSDNKVQIRSLLISECIVHGMWSIPLGEAADND